MSVDRFPCITARAAGEDADGADGTSDTERAYLASTASDGRNLALLLPVELHPPQPRVRPGTWGAGDPACVVIPRAGTNETQDVALVVCLDGSLSLNEPTMALPTAYLMTVKNAEALFNALRAAKAPQKFTQRFLEDLGFKSTNDRLYINVLKALGFLSPDGVPTPRYYEFLDQSQSGRVLAEALEVAYADLFQLRRDAQRMERPELKGKIKTLTQGGVSDTVVDKMALTFQGLCKLADFDAPRDGVDTSVKGAVAEDESIGAEQPGGPAEGGGRPREPAHEADAAIKLGGFVYNVELHLPESRDPAVYEALFRSLKTHLLS